MKKQKYNHTQIDEFLMEQRRELLRSMERTTLFLKIVAILATIAFLFVMATLIWRMF